ncbi:glycosyltransferase family 4 protein [Halomonas sp. GT]|uniref:glycosyltransferase family 4 protein n=1 Tax=Halomonas sp. GT TaxID=1971364 RepID=UPI0012EC495D|nr:glycosyltransferase family 4 protein [Halomonas sp. GT]
MSHVLLWTNMYPTASAPHYGTFVRSTEQAWRKALGDENVELVAIKEKPSGALSKIKLYAGLLGRCCVSLFKQPVGTVLEVHYPVYFLPVLYLASLMKAKRFYIVLRFHGTDLDQIVQSSLFRMLFQRIQKRIDLCVAPSDYFRQKLSHELHFPIERIIKVYPDNIGEEFIAASKALNISTEDAFTIGCVSRLELNKNCQELLHAFAELTIPNKRLVMIGDGTQRQALEMLAERLNVRELVTFTGALPRTKLPNKIAQFSVFVFPSVKESFGLVAVEALACGVPVIANAKLHAAKEYLEEARNGFFYDNGKEGLREAIETFYALSPAQRLALSEQSMLVGRQFSYEQVFTQGVSLILGRQQGASQ